MSEDEQVREMVLVYGIRQLETHIRDAADNGIPSGWRVFELMLGPEIRMRIRLNVDFPGAQQMTDTLERNGS